MSCIAVTGENTFRDGGDGVDRKQFVETLGQACERSGRQVHDIV